MADKANTTFEQEAIDIVKSEKENWEDASAFVTEKVAFQMRNLIRQLRKNYWGVFDVPNDPTTGRKKIWVPLTESIVESIVKNIDLDTKDINFRAKKVEAIGYTSIIRNKVRQILDEMMFGEILDKTERQFGIDGTAVWKILPIKDENGNNSVDIRQVDLLNCYIDPTAESIQKAYRFTERSLMTEDEVKSMKGWKNTEGIQGTYNLSPTESRLNLTTTSSGTTGTSGSKFVDVWEMHGKIPEYLITGNKEDTKEVDARIVVSGLDSQGKERWHIIEKTKGLKPYEELWYKKVPNRWYGRGPAEMVMMMQLYQNTIVNIRIARSYVSQLGIFKIKRNAGITPSMVSRLSANGAISVQNMEDIQQMIVQEASQASYKDEEVAETWSQKVTQAFETITGETLPSTTSATGAAIQAQSANSGMVLIKESIGLFLQRVMKRHILPEIGKNLKQSEVVRLSGEPQELREMDRQAIDFLLVQEIEKLNKKGVWVTPEEALRAEAKLVEQVKNMKDNRFTKLQKQIDPSDYDVQVFVTNEEIDKSVLAQNLITSMQIAPEYRQVVMRQLFDLMGLDVRQLEEAEQQVNALSEAQNAPQGGLEGLSATSLPQLTQQANTAQALAV